MTFGKKRHLLYLLCAVATGIYTPVAAQDESLEEEDTDIDEEFELLQDDENVIYSAAKHEQKIGFSPSAVVVITRKEIEDSGATTLMELLRRWPVTHVLEIDPLFPLVEVRTDYRVLLLVDGREVNHELIFSPFYAFLPVGLQEIERIEIVLGPNSALYGANAVSATINLFTRRPGAEPHARASISGGERGTLELDLGAGAAASPVRFWLTGGHSRADSWMQQGLTEKDMWRTQARALLDLDPLEISLSGGFSRARGRFFSTIGSIQTPGIWMIHAEALARYRELRVRSYWYGLRATLDLDFGLYYPPLQANLATIPPLHLQGDTFHNEAQYGIEPWGGNYLVLGVDVRHVRYHSVQLVIDTLEETGAGLFFHDEQRLGERWMLQAGLRFDWNSRTAWALSPRGAAVWNPSGEHFLRLSGGMSFRNPSLIETAMNFEVEPNPTFPEIEDLFEKYGIANPDLRNELLSSVELGWKSGWLDGRMSTSLDAYVALNRRLIEFRSEAVFEQTPLGPRLNLEKSNIKFDDYNNDQNVFGAHLDIEGKPWQWLELFLRVDLRYAVFIERGGVQNEWHPTYITALGATFFPAEGWQGQAVLMAVGSTVRVLNNPESTFLPAVEVHLPAAKYLMLYLGHRFDAGPMQLMAGVNFFDVFGGRFREERGMIHPDGTNFGGELLGRRVMLLLQASY